MRITNLHSNSKRNMKQFERVPNCTCFYYQRVKLILSVIVHRRLRAAARNNCHCLSPSRVLEASIAENKASLKRTHTEVWSDSPNPHDRKRIENCPVGLKNVGNTCWFSAVIQVGRTRIRFFPLEKKPFYEES